MAHLVERRVGAALPFRERGCRARNVALVEGDAPWVLHGPQVVLGHVDLVVGAPREGNAVALVEKVQACPRHLENVVGVEVACERAPTQQPQGELRMSSVARATAPGPAVNDGPGAGDDRRNVAREGSRGAEVVAQRFPLNRLARDLHAVGGDHPLPGCDHVEGPFGLDVGLVDARPRPVGVVGFKLGVEVDLAVLGVNVAVQSFAATGEARQSANLEREGLSHGEVTHPHAILVVLEVVRCPVNEHIRDLADDVDEGAFLQRAHRQP